VSIRRSLDGLGRRLGTRLARNTTQRRGHTVAVLGGGVAGLSAAQELAERGFDVVVYEAKSCFGGKARSVDVPDTATPGRHPLPGEHGFRFFPGFYHHLRDTLRRIPFAGNTQGVFGNLVPATEMLFARAGDTELVLPTSWPRSWDEAKAVFRCFTADLGIPPDESAFFLQRMAIFLTSCEERRIEEYDHVPWWTYIDAEKRSEPYRKFLGEGATRSLVAMRSDVSSTRTIARVYFQMLAHILSPTAQVDRLLNGPTTRKWIDPWVRHLENLNVRLFHEHRVREIHSDRTRVSHVEVEDSAGDRHEVHADYYIAALPVEAMLRLLNDDLVEAAPPLGTIGELDTAWMNGCQFYLDRDVAVAHGHGLFLDSPWAITTISQAQFWDHDLDRYGDGTVDGILSVVISDWDTPGQYVGKPARVCTKREILTEVWTQLKTHLNDDGQEVLGDDNLVDWYLGDSIEHRNESSPSEASNLEPLLINTVGSWHHRPPADMGTPNFFLASDYVRTNTDLATMESANEAARRAVNAILDDVHSPYPRCAVYDLREWIALEPFKLVDRIRFRRGLPHLGEGSGPGFFEKVWSAVDRSTGWMGGRRSGPSRR